MILSEEYQSLIFSTMPIGADWCWLMLIYVTDDDWCWLMLIDADWCWLMLIGADWCWLMLIDVDWCRLMLIDADWYADWYANWCSLICWFMLIDSDWCSYKVQPSFILSEHTSGASLVILDLSGTLYKPLCHYWSGNQFLNFYIATQWTWRQSSKSGRRRQTRSLQFNYIIIYDL